VIAGTLPSGYDGTFAGTATGTNTVTYPLTTNPGAESTLGTFQLNSAVELQAMANTFFAQSASLGVYVLELGANTVNKWCISTTELHYCKCRTTSKFFNSTVL